SRPRWPTSSSAGTGSTGCSPFARREAWASRWSSSDEGGGVAVIPETVPYEPLPRALAREVGQDGVLVLTIDLPGERVNTLGKSMMAEFDGLLGELETP